MLWVLIRSASLRHFWWVPTTCFRGKIRKKVLPDIPSYLELWSVTLDFVIYWYSVEPFLSVLHLPRVKSKYIIIPSPRENLSLSIYKWKSHTLVCTVGSKLTILIARCPEIILNEILLRLYSYVGWFKSACFPCLKTPFYFFSSYHGSGNDDTCIKLWQWFGFFFSFHQKVSLWHLLELELLCWGSPLNEYSQGMLGTKQKNIYISFVFLFVQNLFYLFFVVTFSSYFSTKMACHNCIADVCFCKEIRKLSTLFGLKKKKKTYLELCKNYLHEELTELQIREVSYILQVLFLSLYDYLLEPPQKCVVGSRSTSLGCFLWLPTVYIFMEKWESCLSGYSSYLDYVV